MSTVTTTRKIFSTVYSVFRNPDNSLYAQPPHSFLTQSCEAAAFFLPPPTPPLSVLSAPPSLTLSSLPPSRRNEMQWAGCGLVFFGILFEMVAGAMKKGKQKAH